MLFCFCSTLLFKLFSLFYFRTANRKKIPRLPDITEEGIYSQHILYDYFEFSQNGKSIKKVNIKIHVALKKAFVAGKTFLKMIILGLGQLQLLFNSKNHMLWNWVNVHVYYWILKWLTTNQTKVYYRLANLHQIQTLLSFIPSFCNFVFTSYQAKLIFCDLKMSS